MILRSNRLLVEIADPGTIYQGTRFDWTGFVVQVTLDGRHTFCVPESLSADRATSGIGLCNEFGIYNPVGYHDSQPGEKFPKLGVGLLTRPGNDDHIFSADYELEPFPVRVKLGDGFAIFETEPLPCRGYEARLRKTVEIRDNVLVISYELENVGTQAIHTQEYNHNFVAINGHPTGPGYLLRLPKGVAFAGQELRSPLISRGRELRWGDLVSAPTLCAANGPVETAGRSWELIHEPSSVGLSETVDVPISRMGLWFAPHTIAPEVFITIDLPPGKCQRWTRRYEFFSL